MMIETMLDLAGFEYDAVERRLQIRPILAGSWPQTGATRRFPCGEATYRLDRTVGSTVHRLTFEASLDQAVILQIAVTCPGLTDLGPWQSSPECPPPVFDPKTGGLHWLLELEAGEHRCSWTWG